MHQARHESGGTADARNGDDRDLGHTQNHPLHLAVQLELVEAVAERAAELVLERLRAEREDAAPELLAVDEAAAFLRCSRQRVYDLRSAGRLSRLGDDRRALVRRAELQALVRGEYMAAERRAA